MYYDYLKQNSTSQTQLNKQAWAYKIFIFRTEKIWNFRTFFRTSESQKRV